MRIQLKHSPLTRSRSTLTDTTSRHSTILPLPLGLLLVLILLFLSGGIVNAENQGPLRELPKPEFKTTPPLFQEWTFDKDKPNTEPGGFMAVTVGEGPEGRWEVRTSEHAPSLTQVLMQSAPCSTPSCYQLLMAEGSAVDYVDLSVRIHAPFGSPSGAGGLVFRATDAKNFYALTISPFSNTIQVLRVSNGQVTSLGKETVIPQPGEWHFLRVNHRTMMSIEIMEIFFDNQMILNLSDTVKGKGQIGLVTTGDSVFAFDNLRAMELLTGRPLSRPPAY